MYNWCIISKIEESTPSVILFIYIYIYIHIDIHFLLGSTDNPNSLLSKIFLFDSPRQRWKGCRRGYLIFPSMYRRPTLRFSRDILSRGGEGGFLINGDLGFLHWIRPDTIIRAKSSPRNTFLPPFFEIQFGIFEPFTFCALFTRVIDTRRERILKPSLVWFPRAREYLSQYEVKSWVEYICTPSGIQQLCKIV